ncbi:MAG: hypothetical protein JST59_23640 [Actinobacteria bacterium]|nr:hypothetical protein [Actinomycetota bacterium]
MQIWVVAFAAAGAACQLVGLWLVIRKIGDDRRRAAELIARPRRYTTPVRKSVRPVPMPARWSSPGGLGTFDKPPDPRQVGTEAARSITTVFNGLVKLKEKSERERDELADALLAEIEGGDEFLRMRFREILESDLTERWIGVAFLFAGILFEAAASITGTIG